MSFARVHRIYINIGDTGGMTGSGVIGCYGWSALKNISN